MIQTNLFAKIVLTASATALVRANWPEACGPEITTMAQFNDAVAV